MSFVLGCVLGQAGIFAQPLAGSGTNEPTLTPLISLDQFLPTTLPTFRTDANTASPPRRTRKYFSIESFGYGLSTPQDFAYSPGYFAALFNLQGLECPRCVLGPVSRSRFTLPPFGAIASLKFHDDRIELFTGFGGLEAWKPDGTFEPRGRSLWTNSYGDAWLTQAQAGVRLAVDRQQHVSLGATGRYLYNFGSGPQHWSTFSGDVTVKLWH
jgi:hypothetical protein